MSPDLRFNSSVANDFPETRWSQLLELRDPTHPRSWEQRGHARFEKKDYAKALEARRKAAK
jgi:hypothetical protein